ncbi:hypothetical protein [Streptomyces kanamyceticus]|uniref:hypothetical protein n=1 Tax=Streptomyces kanamyceticus TaxID=1967 RepID=UPI00123D3A18|nr:hypothetical protein [Streptomyces kanamyceticus]
MSDIYAFDLALDLPESTPQDVLTTVRWHLGQEQSPDGTSSDDDELDTFPLWAARGASHRIGGALWGSLVQGSRGWSLSVRQEIHAEDLPDLKSLVERLVHHVTQEGLIGQVRFHENEMPDLLCKRNGALVQFALRGWEAEEPLTD